MSVRTELSGSSLLLPAQWRAIAQTHADAVAQRTSAHVERRSRGEKHPVEDFLFTYYPFKPAKLAKWHPGAGRSAVVETQADRDYFARRWYRIIAVNLPTLTEDRPLLAGEGGSCGASSCGARDSERAASAQLLGEAGLNCRNVLATRERAGASWERAGTSAGGAFVAQVDLDGWRTERGEGAKFIRALLEATLHREAKLGCFGLHEWAMVYKQSTQEHRHSQVPLRLSQAETDRVVQTHRIQCSHFDAFRFFTPAARPLNTVQPTREGMRENEQPGCLHAGMDLYKWAMKLEPVVGSETVLKCFDLARDIRVLDMEASPYDVRAWGYGVVPIETAAGKAEYMERQEAFSVRAQELRAELLEWIARAGV